MAKWIVAATMTETYRLRVVVDAETAEEAAKIANADDGPLSAEEGERYDCVTEVTGVDPLPEDHEVWPVSIGAAPSVCRDCGKRVRWTGTPATETAPTVPGPWVHEVAA